ncbi:MAG: hypothetical protein HY900_14760 [Deltaproteobacteria bacterium]|nr:hypothetical protein [Deltaproteobacteria bacterium]
MDWREFRQRLRLASLLGMAALVSPATGWADTAPDAGRFGVFMVRGEEQLAELPSVHTRTVRLGSLAAWENVEAVPGSGNYDFSASDVVLGRAADMGVEVVVTIYPLHTLDPGASRRALPSDLDAFVAFVTAFVERYDGDGVADAPGSPRVQYWQVGNEPDNVTESGEKVSWDDTPANYALLLHRTASAVRQADGQAVVLLAGMVGGQQGFDDFYKPMFEALAPMGEGPSFDVFDVHWFADISPGVTYRGLGDLLPGIRDVLESYGYGNVPIWTTEVATYSGAPEGYPVRTEEEQARDLGRMLLYYRYLGVESVFWAPYLEFQAWQGTPNGYFDNTGLVNNAHNDGIGTEKKAYHVYRFLAGTLDGARVIADSALAAALNSGPSHFVEFTNHGRTYYAFWVDDPALAGSTLDIPIPGVALRLYHLMPDDGGEITPVYVEATGGRARVTVQPEPTLGELVGPGPALEVTAPADGTLTQSETIEVTGTTEPGAAVSLDFGDDVAPLSVQADELGQFRFAAVFLEEGSNALTLTSTGTAGTTSRTVHAVADRIGPDLAILQPTEGSVLKTATIDVAGDTEGTAAIDFESWPGTARATAEADRATGHFVLAGQTFVEGENVARISSRDRAGNVTSVEVHFRVDTGAPVLGELTQLGDVTEEEGPYVVGVTASDGDQVAQVSLYYSLNGGPMVELRMTATEGIYSGGIPGQPFGTSIAYYVKAVDRAGNQTRIPSETNHSFRVLDREPPRVSDTTVLTNSDQSGQPFPISTAVTDNVSVGQVLLYYRAGDDPVASVEMTLQLDGRYSASIPAQPLYTPVGYWVVAVDSFGNTDSAPATAPTQVFFFQVAPAGCGAAAVEALPVSTSIPKGSALQVDATLYNLTFAAVSLKVKASVQLPNGQSRDLFTRGAQVAAGASLSQRLSQPVPANAPLGTYRYSLIVMDASNREIGRSEFHFETVN